MVGAGIDQANRGIPTAIRAVRAVFAANRAWISRGAFSDLGDGQPAIYPASPERSLHNGVRLLGLPDYYVTTSFFNQHRTVQQIWLTQAAAIVLAHMLAVILSHVIALQEFASHRRAVISQLPVSAFMVAYTFFGLWLLSSPVAL